MAKTNSNNYSSFEIPVSLRCIPTKTGDLIILKQRSSIMVLLKARPERFR